MMQGFEDCKNASEDECAEIVRLWQELQASGGQRNNSGFKNSFEMLRRGDRDMVCFRFSHDQE
jgi:hypothetical protein